MEFPSSFPNCVSLACNTILVALQERLASGEDVFGPLIEKYLLQNSHRVVVELLPDSELAAKEEAEEKAKLADFKQKLVDQELQEVVRQTQELKERQVGRQGSGVVQADPKRAFRGT